MIWGLAAFGLYHLACFLVFLWFARQQGAIDADFGGWLILILGAWFLLPMSGGILAHDAWKDWRLNRLSRHDPAMEKEDL